MKIYVSHAKKLNFKAELYQPLRESSLNSEHEIILPHEVYEEAKDFVTKDIIKACDVVIAEVSFPATGQGIELGWADAFGRPIICIYKAGSKLSGSLQVVSQTFFEYTDSKDLIMKLEDVFMALQQEKNDTKVFYDLVNSIVEKGISTIEMNTAIKDATIDYVAIFCKSKEEYDRLEQIAKTQGEKIEKEKNTTGKTFLLHKPFQTKAGMLL
jgi:nucleoside 2-deoxyribosyltransferase